jgi:CO/xanthine dehydrogenase FAD-binding subunit
VAPVETPEVVVPASRDEAIQAFGDGVGVTVFGGGTILMTEIAHGRLKPQRALLLNRAGLDGIGQDGGRWTIGATASVAALEQAPEPLATAARHVADYEIRAQATIAGNLCAPPGLESPRGDLGAALIALGAQVTSVGNGGERTDAVEDFIAGGADGRLVLELQFDEPQAAAHAAVRRPHAHAYTVLAVCAARTGDGVRIGVTGAGPHAARARGAEQALAGGDAEAAAQKILEDVTPQDDALASTWYRQKMLPVLVRRALGDLG